MHEPSPGCRVDIWLWRARFVKSRAMAAALVERGAVRLTHQGRQTRLDKPSRCVHPGDDLVFVLNQRVTVVRIEALGDRRGPPSEAGTLYTPLPAQEQAGSSSEPPSGER